jgi:uncharacterized protein (DUF1501 family)
MPWRAVPGYQALVCIFLSGGNDGHNTVIPINTAQQGFGLYQSARGALGLPQASLLPINNGNDVYGLHPQLPEIQGLYNAGNAAVLANVGMLVKADRPRRLQHQQQHDRAERLVLAFGSGWPVADLDSDRSRQHGLGRTHRRSAAILERGRHLPAMTSTNGSSLFLTGTADVRGERAVGIGDAAELRKLRASGGHAAVAHVRQRSAAGAGGQRHAWPRRRAMPMR